MTSLAKLNPPAHQPSAPFIVWPVARREFYLSIQFALLPAIVFAVVVFGWRVLAMLICAEIAAITMHAVLSRFTRRGKAMIYTHTTSAVVIMVALCEPFWPTWLVTIAAGLIPCVVWLIGGTGRERIHVAVVWAVLLQVVTTQMAYRTGEEHGSAILARDRLVMGDIRNAKDAPLYHWPVSSELGGDDAVRIALPQQVACESFDEISQTLRETEIRPDPTDRTRVLPPTTRAALQAYLDTVLSSRLPAIEMLIAGFVPGRIGCVCVPLLILGGLYLAYRYILRPKSVLLFLGAYGVGTAMLLFWPTAIGHLGLLGMWGAAKSMAGELVTLLEYAFFNSDVLFASIFVLALPGTQPLTRRGRRVFLVCAALLAAMIDRLNAGNLPAATASLCVFMPAAPMFDWMFAKRSWMSRGF
ncbi:MAG TPA: RnfABCDGE type electron transport complex subunit D [Phycisphaerae bacterium]|nr:RnfABCDGE type electron transport complex subunit D [Phycisphaerae bacterium]